MHSCYVCKRKLERGTGPFFRVPKDAQVRQNWTDTCQIEFPPNGYVCISHFSPSEIITAGRRSLLMPNAVPLVQRSQEFHKITENVHNVCAVGCQRYNSLYKFPSRLHDKERRKLWLDFFDMRDPNLEDLFVCERHFSPLQTIGKGIGFNAVPDVFVVPQENSLKVLHQKKTKSRKKVTETSPVFAKKQQIVTENTPAPAVLGQNLFNINNNLQPEQLECNPIIEIPIIKSSSKSMFTQTNKRLCGAVEVSEFANDYRFNCFFCSVTFPIEKWRKFLTHLSKTHFPFEEAFQVPKYVSDDHDYTPIDAPSISAVDEEIETDPPIETVIIQPSGLPYVVDPLETKYDPFEPAILNPNIYYVGEENSSVSNTEIVNNFIEHKSCIKTSTAKTKTITSFPLYSTKNTKTKAIRKKYLKTSSNTSAKTKSKVISSGVLYLMNTKRQTSNASALSRCLKRSITETVSDVKEVPEPLTMEIFQQKPTELTYEYTPQEIMDLLLESIKKYPVLWEFDAQPFNEDYYEAVEDLCKIINERWSLNIDTLKMRRSINRVLRFYCSVYPNENIENIHPLTGYYDKCAGFLPPNVHDIAYARCCHCYKCFPNDFELKHHLLEEQRYLQWPYKCLECKECFRDDDEFEFHKILPHYEEIFRCVKCGKKFNRRSFYNSHVASHQPKDSKTTAGEYPCSQCDKIFRYKSNLNNHIRHHGERTFKCHLCPKSYFDNSKLKNHLKIHSSQYDSVCEVCGKGFIRLANLNKHMAMHTGAKVTCSICNLRLRKSSLSRHMRVVHIACEGTIESTYRARCHHFRSLFKGSNRNRPSEYRKNRSYFCKICNIRFDNHKNILEHNKELHFDIPKWCCKICDSEFRYKPSLNRHYIRKHKLHRYQVYKLVIKNEDLESVLTITQEEIDKIVETGKFYTLHPPTNNTAKSTKIPADKTNEHTAIIKVDPAPDEIFIEEVRMHSDVIQDEIMNVADNINSHEIKLDDDRYMNDFFTNLLK